MLLPLLLNNLLDTPGVPSSWVEAVRVGGVAFSADGTMGTIFLDDVTAVPAASFFLGGIAHHSDGRRYVALWPSDDVVFYRGTIACRPDGAMVIVGSGTIAVRPHGWAQTARGEVLASTSAVEIIKDAIGQLQAGHVVMQAIS